MARRKTKEERHRIELRKMGISGADVWLVSGRSPQRRSDSVDKINTMNPDKIIHVILFKKTQEDPKRWENTAIGELRRLAPPDADVIIMEMVDPPAEVVEAVNFWHDTDTKKLSRNLPTTKGDILRSMRRQRPRNRARATSFAELVRRQDGLR